MKKSFRFISVLILNLSVLFSASCKEGKSKKEGARAEHLLTAKREIPVRVDSVKKGRMKRNMSFIGELKASQQMEVSSKFAGKIQKITVEMGQRVKEGDLLVIMDALDLNARIEEAKASISLFQAALTKAEVEQKNARSLLERKEKLAQNNLVTPQELDNAKTALLSANSSVDVARSQLEQAKANLKLLRQQFRDARIRAPFSGFVEARYLDPGTIVNAGTPILRIVNKEPIIVRFQVEEKSIGEVYSRALSTNVEIDVKVDAYPGEIFKGKILRFSPALQSDNRTAIVEASIPNEDGRLLPGMFCHVNIEIEFKDDVLMMPSNAVIEEIGEEKKENEVKAFMIDNGLARLVTIKVGWKSDDYFEVLEGITEGSKVIIEGQGSVTDGARVRILDDR